MLKEEIKEGRTYTGSRWQGDRRVGKINLSKRDGRLQSVVQYVDLRTDRTGTATLEAFAKGAASIRQPYETRTMVFLTGTLTKLRPGIRAGFHGDIGTFPVEHISLTELSLGVHEATIDAIGATEKKGQVLMQIGSAPIIGKCLFVKPI